jgi:hypothetical protein
VSSASASGALDPHDDVVRQPSGQQPVQVVDERSVTRADGRHPDDLAPDQLDAVASSEDADLGHAVVILPREPSSRRRHLDRIRP